jgi:predicted transcriptional regulator
VATERLDVRLDQERRRKLQELAAQRGAPVSEVVRRLIDQAYEEALQVRRRRAARELGLLAIEDAPDAAMVSRQLEGAHEPGGLS